MKPGWRGEGVHWVKKVWVTEKTHGIREMNVNRNKSRDRIKDDIDMIHGGNDFFGLNKFYCSQTKFRMVQTNQCNV
jgi:hypothetical protein